MSGQDEDAGLTVPKFSSFKSKPKAEFERSDKDGADRPTVPKFSSFKSKDSESASAPRRSREGRREHSDEKKRRHRSDRDDDHHTKRRRQESHHREGQRRRSASSRERSHRPAAAPPPAAHNEKSEHFFIDKKGDPLIIKYGGIERSKIPAYYRYGGGRVLGTSGRLMIHREGARDQFSLRMPGEGSALFKDKDGLRTRKSRLRQQPNHLRPRKVSGDDEGEGGYLAISNLKKRDGGGTEIDSADEDSRLDYRSIEGKVGAQAPLDSDSSDEDSDAEDEIPSLAQSNPLKWRSIQLSRQVKEHPEDIDAWIELVDHQDDLLRAGESLDEKNSENEVHSYTEIKVSMLESALSHTASPRDRHRVLNYLMREGVKVWNPKTAEKKWAEVVEDEQDNFLLWKTHMDFRMSHIASFQYDKIKQALVARLHQAVARSEEPRRSGISEAIYVFLRVTRLIHDAGFKELAVAGWQALFELNFFRPHGIAGKEKTMSEFQDFWESEAPRFGEADAQGWKQYADTSGDVSALEPVKHGREAEVSRDSYKAWANAERLRGEEAQCPARTMDEGTEDDPFRVVMYSDIEPLLFLIPEDLLEQITPQIADAFLIFLGLLPHSSSDEWIETARQDPFLTGPKNAINSSTHSMGPVGVDEAARTPPIFGIIGIHATSTPDLLFSGEHWFSFLGKVPPSTAETSFMLQSIRQLVLQGKADSLASYYLALAQLDNSTPLKKVAKTLLKQFSTDSALYTSYALAEYALGNRNAAVKILSSAADIAKDTRSNRLLLWRTWAWLELEAGNKSLAIKRLCSSVDDYLHHLPDDETEIPGSYVLKARQAFSSLDGDIHYPSGNRPQIAAECMALIEYLTADGCNEPTSAAQGNISAAMASIDESGRELKLRGLEGSPAHEGLLQFASRLLHFNATSGPFRRVYMRHQLAKFVGYFPRNTIFLSLLEWSDSSLRVVDETRTLLNDKVLVPKHDCVTSRLFAIQHENRCGNANSTRAAFEHAVRSVAAKSSVQIWISYIRFCHAHKEMRASARDVFYRALRHCPWSKEVMMEAFVTLVQDMKSDELRSVYETMSSKGLRIHVDLEEFQDKARRGQRARAGR